MDQIGYLYTLIEVISLWLHIIMRDSDGKRFDVASLLFKGISP